MNEFRWGSLGKTWVEEHRGETLAPGVKLRKPQYVDVDVDFGEKLKEKGEALANVRKLALEKGVPEHKVKDGFESNLMLFTGSTESQDRYGDRILVDGWDTDEYSLNPVFLGFHDYDAPAIGQCLDVYKDSKKGPPKKGAKKEPEKKRLRFLMLWATEENPIARVLHGLYKGRDMRATSVGFIPGEVQVPGNDDERTTLDLGPFGVLHKAQTLLELSAVSVPALPEAIQEDSFELYRKGLDAHEMEGLRKLAEQIKGLDADLAYAVQSYIPLGRKTVDLAPPKKAALLNPEGDLEDVGAGDGTKKPGDKLDDLEALMSDLADINAKQSTDNGADNGEPPETPPTDPPKGEGEGKEGTGDGTPGDRSSKPGDAENRLIPEDVSIEMAPVEERWVDLTSDDFKFDQLDEEQRALVAGWFAFARDIPPASFEDLKLAHHRAADGYVNLEGVQISMEELLSGEGDGADIPEEDRRGAYDHLAAHLEQYGVEIPEFTEPQGGEGEEGATKGFSGKVTKDTEITAHPGEVVTITPKNDIQTAVRGMLASSSKALVSDLLSEIKAQTGVEIDLEERGGERKWRVVRSHKPETAPVETKFSRTEFENEVGDDFTLRRDCSLIYDANDEKNPKSYLFPHHQAKEGIPVVFAGAQRAMRFLLAKSIDGSISDQVRKRAWVHLRGHYEQFERDAPAFRSIHQLGSLSEFLRDTAATLVEGSETERRDMELVLDLVYMGFMAASDKAFEIQALTFPRETWEKDAAISFIKEYGYEVEEVTGIAETEKLFVYELRAKNDFVRLTERRLDVEGNSHVFTLGGRLKSEAGVLSERLAKLENLLDAGLKEVKQAVEARGGLKALEDGKGNADETFRTIFQQTEITRASLDESMKGLVTE